VASRTSVLVDMHRADQLISDDIEHLAERAHIINQALPALTPTYVLATQSAELFDRRAGCGWLQLVGPG